MATRKRRGSANRGGVTAGAAVEAIHTGPAPGYREFDLRFPEVAEAYERLGETIHAAGPLTPRERRLVKLAIAVGGRLEGAVRSHARRALREGVERAAVDQVAVLAVSTSGLPSAVAALSWIRSALQEPG